MNTDTGTDAPGAQGSPGAGTAPGTVDESTLVPVGRDVRFVFRLVVLMILGGMAAALAGWKIQGAAAGCGASLVRPGATVIPPEGPPHHPPA